MKTPAILLATLVCPFLMTGCVSSPPASVGTTPIVIDQSGYPRALDAAREVLLRNRFEIDRVDAREGVITTLPKGTSGIASPWDREQSSVDQEWADLIHQHEREVRVTFSALDSDEELGVDVVVSVLRVRKPGWRLETESIRHSSHSTSYTTNRRQVPATMREPIGEDSALSQRLSEEIRALINTTESEPGRAEPD